MMGYDTLLTSYYDKYILEYHFFQPWTYNFDIFEIPSGKVLSMHLSYQDQINIFALSPKSKCAHFLKGTLMQI